MTTRGVQYNEFGGVEVLHLGEVELRPMGPDSVVINVSGAGINPVDSYIRMGFLQAAIESHFPIVTAWDVAGVVEAVGPSVSEFLPGDHVFGYARLDTVQHGTAADRVSLPVRVLAKAPTTIDLVTAAAVPLAGLTAYQLVQQLNVAAGDTVLIHNAAGGVGHFAVQLARIAGATVIGTASAKNHDHVRSLGATPVHYDEHMESEVLQLAPHGVDVVIDLVQGNSLERSDSLLAPGARLASITNVEAAVSRGGLYVFVRPSSEDLTALAGFIDAGHVVVDIAGLYSFADAAAAYSRLEEGHVRGKIVLTP